MRHAIWLVLALAACTSAAEKQQKRERLMIEQARADSAAEADFIADSMALAASITTDTITILRMRDTHYADDEGNTVTSAVREAVARNGQVCVLAADRYAFAIMGDTLTCQWGPAQ